MKFRLTVTVDLRDPNYYRLDDIGWAVGAPIDAVTRQEVADHVAEAVKAWGEQLAPGNPFFPRNIREVHVRGKDVTRIT